ncbi:DUF2239 family protein [Microvirga sp. W0021]|uniref:DUF2239 family protein n=1 Tax=Hohaiivirga grylli TaxID=3133970 RepID=A0ABV0BHY5_9HYPH
MSELITKPCTAFRNTQRLSSGPLIEVAMAVKAALEADQTDTILVFDDANGKVVDLDLRGTKADIITRLSAPPQASPSNRPPRLADPTPVAPKGRGRPKLGVVAKEITLLPQQWEWLATQPGGASVTLRKLVEEAKRKTAIQNTKAAQEATYRFMSAMAGDLPGYEEATRALFAGDRERLEMEIARWPEDVREYVMKLGVKG